MSRRWSDLLPYSGLGLIVLACALGPFLPLPDPVAMDMRNRFAGPSAAHWLGQDEFGRDVAARLILGTGISLVVAVSAGLLAGIVGATLGIVAGYMRGMADMATLRLMDLILCFPPLLMAMLFVAMYGAGISTLVPTLALVFVPGFTRVAYAAVITVRSQEYVYAVKTMGASTLRIMLGTILPNIMGPLLVQLSLAAASAIVLESGLSFLGLGILPPSPSLGLMIGAARSSASAAPWLLILPCLALVLLILAVNATCDALRDRFDPRSAL